ncbi:helix-turn-helix domain-containing protein [Robertmurraya kyonggiensis]|uniref:Helix-turn-helix domain-containing protein n=2 Tax=Robertmurraya kyonggiensis TaxID=1037680 RepID=A0A4U1D0I4_9BACI|nr:helix-turn-helix domain-containing protein [Robertmurraya kyonggiensis]
MEVRGEMIMRPTVIEREILTGSAAHDYTKKMVETDLIVTATLVKHLLFTVKGAEQYRNEWNEANLSNREKLVEYLNQLLVHISTESIEESTVTYSTSEVAKFIGVSQQTINAWIRDGKIKGVEKDGSKWSKIPEDAEVILSNGKRFTIATLKANWEAENQEPEVNEITYLEHSIKELEEKYDGKTFEEVFGDKTILELTEEDTDASVWLSYKVRLESAKNARNN